MTVRERINQIHDIDCASILIREDEVGRDALIVARRLEAVERYLEERYNETATLAAQRDEALRKIKEFATELGDAWGGKIVAEKSRDLAQQGARDLTNQVVELQSQVEMVRNERDAATRRVAEVELRYKEEHDRDTVKWLDMGEMLREKQNEWQAKCAEIEQAQRLSDAERAVVEAAERWGSADHTDVRAPADLSRAIIELRAQRQASAEAKGG